MAISVRVGGAATVTVVCDVKIYSVRLSSANVTPETVERKASAAACDSQERSDEGNRETDGCGEEGLPQGSSLEFSLRQWRRTPSQAIGLFHTR